MIRSHHHRTSLFVTVLILLVPSTAEGRGGLLNWFEGICEHHEACMHGKFFLAEDSFAIDQAWEETTGRDLRNYPPDRLVNYQHMRLEMHFEDLNDKSFTATETLRFEPIGSPTAALTLHAVNLDIHDVRMDSRSVEFHHDDEVLTVRFDPPLELEYEYELVIHYTCERPVSGMFFTPFREEAPHYSAEVHTQGQTESNRHWFVAHDFPNEMMTTELIVDVPAEYKVSSNGRLVEQREEGNRAVWHWLQDKPHVSYLVTLSIGKFDVVELAHDRVPMQAWVPEGLGYRVEQTYGNTGPMIDLFEKLFGVEYPWDRYDQLVVKNFGAGGMENTAATNMYPTAILDEIALLDRDLDGLIAHELAHQWAGNLLTCKHWAHIWLNEGWATIGTALWYEERDGEDGYLDAMRRNFGVARRDNTTNKLPMVSPVYDNSWETFRRAANPYPKGASILHMLRRTLGEEVFWEGTRIYFTRHQHEPVETSDLRYAYEEASGKSLEWFFEQWCYRPGTPDLHVDVAYDGRKREFRIDIEQKQHIDWRTPAFRFTLPVYVRTHRGERTFAIDVTDQHTTFRRELDAVPTIVAIDPDLHVLKEMHVEKSMQWWLTQAKEGPTIAARHEAVQALGRKESSDHRSFLAALIRDESERYSLRRTAVDSLIGYGTPEAQTALLAILDDGIAEARVRSHVVGKLRRIDREDAVSRLETIAAGDESYAARVAAIEGLAHHKAKEHADVIVKLVEFESQHDQVRNAALRALAELDDPRGLDLGKRYAQYGYMDRSRPVAIEVIGTLAKHDRDDAVSYLLPLLHDPERRTVQATGRALAKIGDNRAIEPIRAMAETHRNPAYRRNAEQWLAQLTDEADG